MYDYRWKSSLRRRLLKWFDDNQRKLPWRENKTAYRIWVSEIMLQQTQVQTVVDYFNRFVKKFPNVRRLADAEQQDVLKLWEGLGYYRRARQLHDAARLIVELYDGEFPTDIDSVVALPGIGQYTAGAILSIAHDQKLPILEANTIRLFARLMAMKTDPRKSANLKSMWEFSESLLPNTRVGDFNQALMELGSTICQPKSPQCDQCPLSTICPTFMRGLQSVIPAATKKKVYEEFNEAVVIVRRSDKYLIRLCGSGERWTGLWDFPRFQTSPRGHESTLETKLKELTGLSAKLRDTGQTIRHCVTRFRITLDCFVAEEIRGRLKRNGNATLMWSKGADLKGIPMCVTGRKIANRLLRFEE